MKNKHYLTIPQAAKILGISRIAVYQKVRKGQIKAEKIGRTYAIPQKLIFGAAGSNLTVKEKRLIAAAVRKTVRDFGETLKLLGQQ